ncbi:uncharacterized protein LOC101158564 [Oryzias latipes]|uniref:uncharacterized protein LOC101158564 n=1 Tax=Oryzias latipes TaxID=8090 RepID=UPI0005CC2021|nr:uncharacterized protein LOC101158564 [Oryzias latipes]
MTVFAGNNSHHLMKHAASIILAFISQMISDVFFILSQEGNVPNALFQNSARNVSNTFYLEVTMDWWSDNCWIVIDLWSKAWLVYAAVSLYRRNALGPESCNPEIHPPIFHLIWTVTNVLRMSSMYMWDKHYIVGAVLLRWFLPVYSFYMLYMSYSSLSKHKAWLAINNPNVISWTRYLTQNGLAVFAWWSLFNASVGLGVALKYNSGVPDPVVSTVVLSILSICIAMWFILQILLLPMFMGHTFSIYGILILGLGAMFTNSYRVRDFSINTAVCGVLMVLITVMSFIHLITSCLKTERKPLAEPALKFNFDLQTVCQLEVNNKHKLPN